MAGSIQSMDQGFPTRGKGDTADTMVDKITSYLYTMTQSLQYSLNNLGSQNFNDADLKNVAAAITGPILQQVSSLANTVTELAQMINSAALTVDNTETSWIVNLVMNGTIRSSIELVRE